MPSMIVALAQRMTVDEFLVWSERQETGRYELQDGVVILQQSQNWAHLKYKAKIYVALQAAIDKADVPFYAAPDGATVRISPRSAFEPDALVAALPTPDDRSLEIPHPIIVVEVLSPGSIKRDLSDKLTGYFQLPSIQHYLVLDPEDKMLIWHRRRAGGGLEQPITMSSGSLTLAPPGLTLDVASIFV